MKEPPYVIVDERFRPIESLVYVCARNGMFYAGQNPFEQSHVSLWSSDFSAAMKYDSFRDLAARDHVTALARHYGGEVRAYRRMAIFPESYAPGNPWADKPPEYTTYEDWLKKHNNKEETK